MQTLNVKTSAGSTKTVHIIRSFQDISGAHVFLHANGTYGYKDGTPVRSIAELEKLPPEHRKPALDWWARIGEKQSVDYYAAIAEQAAQKAGDFQQELAASEANSALDSVLYVRKTKAGGAVTNAKPWMEFGFPTRPDWWGQAKNINFADYSYKMQELSNAPDPAVDIAAK